ncbi:hypothetical protein [Aliidiomarina halalkaliphila]|uniref:hypothetical protein n=1 Tax=Aliidiomarina halalkaliphila TaxID=2593535 RepID=UPI00163D8DB5|nr:hypothetical protein [Aliidiomarina halalkaliphila]
MGRKGRVLRNERRRQLWKRHQRSVADRRSKWFYTTETCHKVSLPIDCREPEEL